MLQSDTILLFVLLSLSVRPRSNVLTKRPITLICLDNRVVFQSAVLPLLSLRLTLLLLLLLVLVLLFPQARLYLLGIPTNCPDADVLGARQ